MFINSSVHVVFVVVVVVPASCDDELQSLLGEPSPMEFLEDVNF